MRRALERFGPWRVVQSASKLGSGNFGTVLPVEHYRTSERCAVKVEEPSKKRPRLPTEAAIYRELRGKPGFPKLRWYGQRDGALALVLDLLGPSLRAVHRQAGGALNVAALQHVGLQSLLRLETLHDLGWLHCDIKPANLLLPPSDSPIAINGWACVGGADKAKELGASVLPALSLIDFGLSQRWRDTRTGLHLPAAALPRRRAGVPLGTGRFASLRNHSGEPFSRRDDLEALAISLVWLRKGTLPWSELMPPPASKKERFAAMLACKARTSIGELSTGMPNGFEQFFDAIRTLSYHARPEYCELAAMLAVAQR